MKGEKIVNQQIHQIQAQKVTITTQKEMCELPQKGDKESGTVQQIPTIHKPAKLIYFTDPICSSCWSIEPHIRKLELEYQPYFEIEYRTGGLLKDWTYDCKGISNPKDVAKHWDEVSQYYGMPIDGDLWLEDPLDSSYPVCIAFKASQLQGAKVAKAFLRRVKELLFLHKINMAIPENLQFAAKLANLDVKQFKSDFEGKANDLFHQDLDLANLYGVRGFPTIYFINNKGRSKTIFGTKPYHNYESALLEVDPTAKKQEYKKDWQSLFSKYSSFTEVEYAELAELCREEARKLLDNLVEKNILNKHTIKNGSLWTLRSYTS